MYNKGLGMGLINHSKNIKVMLVVFLHTSWISKTQCPRFAEESLFQKLGCNLTILCLWIKKIILPIFVLLHSCIWWIMNCFNYFIMNMHLINHWYIYKIFLEEFVLCRWIGEALEALEETERGEDQTWINRHKLGMLSFLPIPNSIYT